MAPDGTLTCSQDAATDVYTESNNSNPISLTHILILSSYVRKEFRYGLFHWGFPTNILKRLLMRAICPPNLT